MTINEAIAKVMQTQFKKDMGEALEIVEAAGFVVRKIDGGYEVFNPETKRELFIGGRKRGYRVYVYTGTYNGRRVDVDYRNPLLTKIDYEGFLRKPYNHDWYKVVSKAQEWRSETRQKYERLQDAKNFVKWEKVDIERTKKKIEELQKELFDDMRRELEAEKRLESIRKELNLRG